MRHSFKNVNSRRLIRLAATGLAAALLAGCSSDASRFNNAFSNPFTSQADPLPTGTIPGADTSVPRAPVQSRPLPAISSRPLAAPQAQLSGAPARVAARQPYNTPPAASPETTAAIARPVATGGRANGWSAEGGTPIVVAQGETASMLATRYGVPETALLQVNGFGTANQVQPGSRLVVPVYNASARAAQLAPAGSARPLTAAAAPRIKPFATKPAPTAKLAAMDPKQPGKAKVDAKAKLAAKPAQVPQLAALAPAKGVPAKLQATKPADLKQVADVPAKTAPVKVAKLEKPSKADGKKPDVDSTPVASLPPQAAPVAAAGSDAANPEFRWPARGRVIQGFKAGGNDGINIAVPEGTSVKAAEGGVVAYAGSELKGYGNLVLIRHPNGFVSAYANNGDIEVKRGDTVKRGQTIAKSGQSGNVSSPQLHFELRKGSTPVDPTNYLAGL